jgi:hypothetical protein
MPAKQRSPLSLHALRLRIATAEALAAESQAEAKRRIMSIARDLLPKAAAHARRGRPRLLAVCAKIIGAPNLQANLKAARFL